MSEKDNNMLQNDSKETINPHTPETAVPPVYEAPAEPEIPVPPVYEAPAEPEIPAAPVYENPFDTDVTPVKKQKKGKGKKIAIISGITAAVLVGGGVAAYNLSDFVKNQVNLLIMKPDKYYAWVTEKNASVYADKAAKSYRDDIDTFDNGKTTSIELKYDISDEAKDILIEKINEDPDNTSADIDMLSKIINNADDLSILLTGQSKETDAKLSLGANLNDDSLLTFDMAFDFLNPKLFMRYPEMKEQWIGMDLMESIYSNMENDDDKEAFDKVFSFYQGIIGDPSEFISPKELKAAVNNYSAAWIKSISDVDRKRREKVSIGDITTKYTTLDVDIDSELAVDILRNILKEASDDKVIKRTVIDRLDLLSEDEYEDLFDTVLKASKFVDTDNDDIVSLKTYIDPLGTIRGFSLYEDDTEVFYALGKHKDDYSIEFSVTVDGTEMVSFVIDAEETSKDTYEGTLSINLDEEFVSFFVNEEEESAEDYTITMDFEDMTIGSLDNIKLTGDAVLNIPDHEPIKLEFNGKDKTQSISYNIEFDGTDYGEITLTFKTKNKSSFEIPEVEDSYMVAPEEADSFDFYDYMEYDDILIFASDLLIKIGFDEDIAAEVAENVADDIFYGNDDEEEFDEDSEYEDFEYEDFDFEDFDIEDFKNEANQNNFI